MIPNNDYMEQISKKLDRLNVQSGKLNFSKNGSYMEKMDIIKGVGDSGLNYIKNAEEKNIGPDPLFPDRNR
jgi:hypothetical protein